MACARTMSRMVMTGRSSAIGLAGRRVDRRRAGRAHAAAEHVGADDEVAIGVDRPARADQRRPPARLAGDRIGARRRTGRRSARGRSGWRWTCPRSACRRSGRRSARAPSARRRRAAAARRRRSARQGSPAARPARATSSMSPIRVSTRCITGRCSVVMPVPRCRRVTRLPNASSLPQSARIAGSSPAIRRFHGCSLASQERRLPVSMFSLRSPGRRLMTRRRRDAPRTRVEMDKAAPDPLQAIRVRIDAIDEAVHRLLIERRRHRRAHPHQGPEQARRRVPARSRGRHDAPPRHAP